MSATLAIAKNGLRLLRSDPMTYVLFLVMPILTMGLTRRMLKLVLGDTHTGASGAELAVPQAIGLFSFFLVGNIALSVFSEHGWNTWHRLRATGASPLAVLGGKVAVPAGVLFLQIALLLLFGVLLFDLRLSSGEAIVFLTVGWTFGVCLTALALAIIALCRSALQASAISNLAAVVFGAFGGAIAPIATLPTWMHAVAKITPTYWAVDGMTSVTLDHAGFRDIVGPLGALSIMTAACLVVAVLRFDDDSRKLGWS